MRIVEHRLEEVPFEATENKGGPMTPEYLVVHYTANRSVAGTVAAFRSKVRPASAHLIVGEDGGVIQMVPFNVQAWHAGQSSLFGRSGWNGFSIGIELVNPGYLEEKGGKVCDAYGREWKGETVRARHKNKLLKYELWAPYTTEQLETLREVGTLLVQQYGLRDVVGHDDIAPTRKFDPGPAFPMESFRSSLFGRSSDGPEAFEVTTVLNIRKGPGTDFEPVANSPLAKGTRVEFVEARELWWHVLAPQTGAEGWVHSKFLQRV